MLRFRFFFTFFFSPMSWGTRQLFNTENGVGHQPVILGMGCCLVGLVGSFTSVMPPAAFQLCKGLLSLLWSYCPVQLFI